MQFLLTASMPPAIPPLNRATLVLSLAFTFSDMNTSDEKEFLKYLLQF
jgi:hypothetical protein